MIRASVVTAEQNHAFLIWRLLPSQFASGVQVVSGGSSYGAQSLASSIMIAKRRPVALIVDAHSWKEHIIQQQRDTIEFLLRPASGSVLYRLLIVKPEVEMLYFQDRVWVERMIGNQLDDVTWTTAHYEPKKVLEQIFGNEYHELYNRLDDDTIARLREHPVIRDLTRFLTQMAVQPT